MMTKPANRKTLKRCINIILLAGFAGFGNASFADLASLEASANNEIERQMLRAFSSLYSNLQEVGCQTRADLDAEGLIVDGQLISDFQTDPNGDTFFADALASCTTEVYQVYRNAEAFAHTANALSGGDGPTDRSLGLTREQFNDALRWTAAEEFASQGAVASSFSSTQTQTLGNRLGALRNGAAGFGLSLFDGMGSFVTGHSGDFGGGASADTGWSPWGGFLNASYLRGDRDGTALEDGYKYRGYELNGGVDYRLDYNWVAGVTVALQEQDVNFNEAESIVRGGVDSSAISLTPFALYQADRWFLSGSLGWQQIKFDNSRSIMIGTGTSSAISTVAISSTNADIISPSFTAGFTFDRGNGDVFEPYISIEYQNITIDAFEEVDTSSLGFNVAVPAQTFSSLETIAGIKLQHIYSGNWGMVVPYMDIQWRHQAKTGSRGVKTNFSATSVLGEASVNLPTDELAENYAYLSFGLTSVIRGASQKKLGVAATGGIQVFANFQQAMFLRNYNESIFSAGFRFEF